MQLVLGSQVVPWGRFISKQLPFDGMHAATLHEPLGGGHAAGGSSQMPKAHTAPATHCPPGSQVLPFDLYSAAQPPVRASQMPTVHGPSKDEQSRGVPEQTPLLQVPIVKQPVTPHVSPVVGA